MSSGFNHDDPTASFLFQGSKMSLPRISHISLSGEDASDSAEANLASNTDGTPSMLVNKGGGVV
eukprot:749760-Hanusia_phi.AAC.2